MKNKLIDLVNWTFANYAFVAKGKGRITGKQFAELIEENFACEPYENYLSNIDEDKNLIAKEIAERCITYISVGYTGDVKAEYSFNKLDLKDLIHWGL